MANGDLDLPLIDLASGSDEDEEVIFEKPVGLEEISNDQVEVEDLGGPFSLRKLWAFTGPGFLMSIAYLDPGNLEADLQIGAFAGYNLIWVLVWSTFVGWILQRQAIILGLSSGRNLAEICRTEYPFLSRCLIFLMTELIIIGSDVQEVVGSAIAINILSRGYIPLWGGVLITVVDTFTFLFLENYGIRRLEFLFGGLVTIMAITFGVEAGIAQPSAWGIFKGAVVPYLPPNTLVLAVSLVGAIIMPHNIYLHSALVQTRKVDRSCRREVAGAVRYSSIEAGIALFVSVLINICVVAVFASGFYPVDDAGDIGIESASALILDRYGSVALYIWAVGLLAAGQSSTMTGTYSGQFVMRGFWKLNLRPWQQVLLTRSLAIVPAIVVCFVAQPCDYRTGCDVNSDGEASNYLDVMNMYINVAQSMVLPFALLPLLTFVGDSSICKKYRSSNMMLLVVWVLAIILIAINFFQCGVQISQFDLSKTWIVVCCVIFMIGYVISVLHLLLGPSFRNITQLKSLVENWRESGEQDDDNTIDYNNLWGEEDGDASDDDRWLV